MSSPDAYDDDDDYTREEYDREARARRTGRGASKWISAIIALAGVWLVVEPFLFDILPGNFWNDVIVGIALIVLGGYNYYRRSNLAPASVAVAALAALIGLWLIISPWVYGVETDFAVLTTQVGFWNDVIVGLVVLVLGAYSAYEAREANAAPTTQ